LAGAGEQGIAGCRRRFRGFELDGLGDELILAPDGVDLDFPVDEEGLAVLDPEE
jgi:hypothetical protein